jgi:hypothetical protein
MRQAGIPPTWRSLGELFDIDRAAIYKKLFNAPLTYIERFIHVAEALSLTPKELLEIIKECRKVGILDAAPNVVPPIEKKNSTNIEESAMNATANERKTGE